LLSHSSLNSEGQFHCERDTPLVLGLPVTKVAARLDSLLLVLKSCKGERCQNPWGSLHPDGSVSSLEDALSSDFDGFYEKEQVKIQYERCEKGYLLDAEGPQWETDGQSYKTGTHWSDWV
jgi:hypothetical protein